MHSGASCCGMLGEEQVLGVSSRICYRHIKFEVPIQVEIMSRKVSLNIE